MTTPSKVICRSILVVLLAGPACGMRTELDIDSGAGGHRNGGASGSLADVAAWTGPEADVAVMNGSGGAAGSTVSIPGTGGAGGATTIPSGPDAPAVERGPDAGIRILNDGSAPLGQRDGGTGPTGRGDSGSVQGADSRIRTAGDGGFATPDVATVVPNRDSGVFAPDGARPSFSSDGGRTRGGTNNDGGRPNGGGPNGGGPNGGGPTGGA